MRTSGKGFCRESISKRRLVVAVVFFVGMLITVGGGSPTARASTCDNAAVSDEAELTAARTCYQGELAGSITTVTLDADIALAGQFRPFNNNGALFVIEGAGHSITGPSSNQVIENPAGPLTLNNVTLIANAPFSSIISQLSDETLTIRDSTLTTIDKGAIFVGGDGTVIVENSLLTGTAEIGIRVNSSTSAGVTVTNSTIRGFSTAIVALADVDVIDSTLSNNRTGISVLSPASGTATNSTIVGSAEFGRGVDVRSGATMSLIGVTIADFPTDRSFTGLGASGDGEVTLTGSTIARAVSTSGDSCEPTLTIIDGGGNVVQGDCGLLQVNENAATGLGVLSPSTCAAGVLTCTDTIPIVTVASPLVGAWGDCLATLPDDQRGEARTAASCDAGAFESAFSCPTTAAVEAELIGAFNCYNLAGDGDVVSVTLSAGIAISAALPVLANDTTATFTIEGAGQTLTGLSDVPAIDIADGDVTINDITVDGPAGSATSVGAVVVGADGDVTINASTFTTGAQLHVRVEAGSVLVVNDSLFEASATTQRIVSSLNSSGSGVVTITNSTFKDATSSAISDLASATISDSTFSGNSRSVEVPNGGTAVVTNSTISGGTSALRIEAGGNLQATGVTMVDSPEGITGSGAVGVTGTLIARVNLSCHSSLAVTDNGGNVTQGACGAIPATPTAATGLGSLGPSTCGPAVTTCTDTVPISSATSPAVNAWGTCSPVVVDQRGETRSAGNCDAGAFESPFDCATGPIGNEAELVVAINCYNLSGAGADSTGTLTADLALTTALPTINNATDAEFELVGAGFMLTAAPSAEVLNINDGSVTLSDITAVGSTTSFGDDPPVVTVGAAAELTLDAATVTEPQGNAIEFVSGATISIVDSDVEGAIAGLNQEGVGSAATVNVTNSTISAALTAIRAEGSTTVTRSTIEGRLGYSDAAGASLIATNSTFAGLSPSDGLEVDGVATLVGVTIVDFTSDALSGSGQVDLSGVLLARNGKDCELVDGLTVIDSGGNLVEDGCDVLPAFPDAEFGVGTLTTSVCQGVSCPDTVPLSADSFAVNAWGDCGSITDDQRGVARTANQCDAGAFEAFDCPTIVDSAALLTLGIRCYNDAAAGTTTTLTLETALVLASSLPIIDNPTDAALVINGDDNTLNGAAVAQTFNIANADVTVTNLTLSGSGAQLIVAANASKLTVTNTLLTGAEDDGIVLSGNAQLTMTDSTMLNNSTDDLNGRSIDNRGGNGAVVLTRVELANEVGFSAYGVSGPNLTVVDSTFAGFVSAVEAGNGSTISNTTISENRTGLVTEGAVGINHVTSVNDTRSLSVRAGSTATLANSLVAARFGGCVLVDQTAVLVDGLGNVVDNGCGPIAATFGAGDDLGALAANACAPGVACTKTQALGPTSLALGAADTCGLPVDQRGVARPSIDCDAGAYEAGNFDPTAVDDIVNTPESFQDDVYEDDSPLAIDVLANDSDPESVLTVTAVSGLTASSGTVAIDSGGTGVTYTLAPNFNGTATFDYTATDAAGATDTAMVTVEVFPRNDPPEVGDDAFTVDEDSSANVFDVLANDEDIDGDTLTLQNTSNYVPSSGFAVIADGKLEFTPTANFVGEITFDYAVRDIDTFDSFTRTGTVTVTVENVNEAPSAFDDNTASVVIIEDSGANTLDVLDNDTDPDTAFGDSITVASVTQPATGGTAAISADGGAVILTPDDDYSGSLRFTYVVRDTAGLLSETATVFAFVTEVNDKPIANDDDITIDENTEFNIPVLDNDIDVDHAPSQFDLTVTQPANGTTSVFGQRIKYVAPQGFLGETTFTYTIEDPDGERDTATVTVTVVNINEDPVSRSDFYSIDQDSGTTEFDVLANDDDPDVGDSITIVSITAAANGTATLAGDGQTVSYSPDPGFTGSDEFTYTINDDSGSMSTARVSVFIRDTNQQPVATDDAITVQPGLTVRLDVLSNDSDPDGEALTIVDVTQPFPITAGRVEIIEDGTAIQFVALPGFTDGARFVYTVSDAGGKGDFGRVVLRSTVDTLCGSKVVTIDMNLGDPGVGTAGDDVILGTAGDDVIDGGGGNDTICGLDGRDRIRGGSGDDTIFGGFGIDYLYGDAGEDTIDGQGGSDRMFGGPGNDLMLGNSGADRMFGGDGDDEMRGMGGQDFMWGEEGNDLMQGNFQTDNMWGGPGDDTMFGAGGKDSLFGEAGNDSLSGGNNTDYLDGGDGVDTANGGRGRDKPVIEPSIRASNGQLFDGSGCIAETIANCQPA